MEALITCIVTGLPLSLIVIFVAKGIDPMSNTASTIVVPASSTGTVVQSIGNAALWTFVQSFLGTFIGLATPVIALIQQDLQDAGPFDSSNVVLLGWFALSAIAGGLGAILSLIKNHFKTTLPAGEAVVAQAKK